METKPRLGNAISTWLSSLPAGEASVSSTRLSSPDSSGAAVLTRREVDVLRLLGGGCTSAQAAARLGISPHTVVTHLKNAYRKLDVHSAAAAVMRALQLGLFQS